MLITSSAPSRIDLAGGTLDIYPLYVFENGGTTINAAINLKSEVTIETRNDSIIKIRSEDLQQTIEFSDVSSINPSMADALDLVCRAVKFFHHNKSVGLNISTKNNIPKGSGLGASSALLIAISNALVQLNNLNCDKETIIYIAADIEAQSIRIPTGKQDYYPATYGGINAIHFDIGKIVCESIAISEDKMKELEDRLILSFTGETRFSGTSNWNMMKRYIDNSGDTVRNMSNIKETAFKMYAALQKGDLEYFGELLAEEWENRKKLAEGVTTPKIDILISEASQSGAISSKICGAGGGGCMITFTKSDRKKEVAKTLTQNGATVIDFSIAKEGVNVE